MPGSILTPISLWKDFDASLPTDAQTLSERTEEGLIFRKVRFSGRQTEKGRVRIYAALVRPETEEPLPALLLLTKADSPIDLPLAVRFAKRGYCVLCMDYRGKTEETGEEYTVYPEDIPYADYARAGRTLLHADGGAVKTAWYEWTAAAVYAVRYLRTLSYVSSVGGMGVREGGEILWKLMTIEKLSGGICVDAAGWLAYRGIPKFGEEKTAELDEERRMFVAGIESQSYAPFVQCPVLMLIAAGDPFVDADRAYDTFVRVNKEYFSTIDYSVACGGGIDRRAVRDVDMFMDKFFKEREIFLAHPLGITFSSEEGKLCASISSDTQGEIASQTVYYSEDNIPAGYREWNRGEKETLAGGREVFSMSLCSRSDTVFAFARAEYSNGFCVSSRIAAKKTDKETVRSVAQSRLLYDSRVMKGDFFVPAEGGENATAAFSDEAAADTPFCAVGYGGIEGIACRRGLKTYRVGHKRYLPDPRALLHLSVYGKEDFELTVSVKKRRDTGEEVRYTHTVFVAGGGKWKNLVLPARDFKSEVGATMDSFVGGESLSFTEREEKLFLLNNVLWI